MLFGLQIMVGEHAEEDNLISGVSLKIKKSWKEGLSEPGRLISLLGNKMKEKALWFHGSSLDFKKCGFLARSCSTEYLWTPLLSFPPRNNISHIYLRQSIFRRLGVAHNQFYSSLKTKLSRNGSKPPFCYATRWQQ